MSNSSTNITINLTLDLTGSIITITTWSVSILAYLLAFFVIIMSRSNLNRIELWILIVICLSNSISKLCYIISYTIPVFSLRVPGPCFTFVFGVLFILFDFVCCSTLFQYSLFQISSLSRAKLFLLLFDTVHSVKGYIIIQIVIFIIAIILNLIQWLDNFIRNCSSGSYKVPIVFCLEFFGTRFLIISSYLLATFYVFSTRFFHRKAAFSSSNNSQNDSKRFRRNLNLLLKFNLLSVLFAVSYLPIIIVYFVDLTVVMSTSFSLIKMFVFYFPLLVYVIHPLLLIYVHNILKATFKRVFLRAG